MDAIHATFHSVRSVHYTVSLRVLFYRLFGRSFGLPSVFCCMWMHIVLYIASILMSIFPINIYDLLCPSLSLTFRTCSVFFLLIASLIHDTLSHVIGEQSKDKNATTHIVFRKLIYFIWLPWTLNSITLLQSLIAQYDCITRTIATKLSSKCNLNEFRWNFAKNEWNRKQN